MLEVFNIFGRLNNSLIDPDHIFKSLPAFGFYLVTFAIAFPSYFTILNSSSSLAYSSVPSRKGVGIVEKGVGMVSYHKFMSMYKAKSAE